MIDPNEVTIIKVGSLPGIPTLVGAYVHMIIKGQGNYAVDADLFCFKVDHYNKTQIDNLLLQQANDIITQVAGSRLNFQIGNPDYPDAPEAGATVFTLPDEFYGKAWDIYSSDLIRYLDAGEDYTIAEDGLTMTLLNGVQFSEGGYWNFKGGEGVGANAIQKEKYTLYTEIPTGGQDALILCDQDNSSNGDNTESQFIRQNNKLFYLVTVEQ